MLSMTKVSSRTLTLKLLLQMQRVGPPGSPLHCNNTSTFYLLFIF